MKQISFFISLLLLLNAKTALTQVQKTKAGNFKLTGQVIGRDNGIIILWYPGPDGNYKKDTTQLSNEKFNFEGKIGEPSFVWLIGDSIEGMKSFYLEPGQHQIFLKKNKFENAIAPSSFTQRQQDSLTSILKRVDSKYKSQIQEYDSLIKKLRTISDSVVITKMSERIDEIRSLLNQEHLKNKLHFIIDHPNSYVSPSHLYGIMINRGLNTDSVNKIYELFSAAIRNSIPGKMIKDELNKRQTNIEAKNFTAKDIANKEVSLIDFRGKYVLLDFWASWCIPCIKQFPKLKHLSESYSAKGFEIITISIDSNKKNWEAAVKKYSIQNFQNLLSNEDIEKKYSNTRQPIPSQLLINRKGIIIWNSMNQSSLSLDGALEKEFNE